MSQWYFQKDGNEVGPVSATQLVELAGRGALQADTPVRRSDMPQSMPAKEVKELRSAIASHAPDRAADPTNTSTDPAPVDTTQNKYRTAISLAICVSLVLPFSVLFLALLWTREHTDNRIMAIVAIIIGLLSVIPSVVVARTGLAATAIRKRLVTALIICGSAALIVIATILMNPAVPNAIGWLLCLVYLTLAGILLARLWNSEYQYRLNAFARFALVIIPAAVALSVLLLPSDNASQVSKSLHMPSALWGPGADGMIQLQLPASAMSDHENTGATKLSDDERTMAHTIIEQSTRVLAWVRENGRRNEVNPTILHISEYLSMLVLINGSGANDLEKCARDAFGASPNAKMLLYEATFWASSAWCANSISDREVKKRLSKVLWARQPNLVLIQSNRTRQLVAAKYCQAAIWLGDEERLDKLIPEVNGEKGPILRADEPGGRELVKALLLSGRDDRIQPWIDAQPFSTSFILIQRGDVDAAAKITASHTMEDYMQVVLLMQCALGVAYRDAVSPNPYMDDMRRLIEEIGKEEAEFATAMAMVLDVIAAAEEDNLDEALRIISQSTSDTMDPFKRDAMILTALCALKVGRPDDASLLLDQLPIHNGRIPISLLRQAIEHELEPVKVIRQVTGIDTEFARGRPYGKVTNYSRVIELLYASGIKLKDVEWVNTHIDWSDRRDVEWSMSPESFWILSRNELIPVGLWTTDQPEFWPDDDSISERAVGFLPSLAAAIIGRSGIPLSADHLDADTNMTAFPLDDLPTEEPIGEYSSTQPARH